jgi:hypothetical protein
MVRRSPRIGFGLLLLIQHSRTGKDKEQGYGQALAGYWFRQYDAAHHA